MPAGSIIRGLVPRHLIICPPGSWVVRTSFRLMVEIMAKPAGLDSA